MAKSNPIPADRLALYERLVATQSGLQRKGATVPYTSVNGNMFSFLTPEGTLAMRLRPAERAAFVERFDTALHEAHGTVMKEYVTVPFPLLEDTEQLLPYFAASYTYASSLKPKPTRRAR
jgi:hypothetical protein